MSKVISFEEFHNMQEDVIVAGFGPDYLRPYTLTTTLPITGYSMKPIGGYVEEACNIIIDEAYAYENSENPEQTAEGYMSEAKKHINERLVEMYETRGYVSESALSEAEEYKFDPVKAEERLKKREEMNIKRFRAAQERNDNYAIELYQLRIKLDKIEREKLKVQTAIFDLKKQFKKDE
jgi:hypothetical protein